MLCRLQKLILKSLNRITEDLILRKMIWLIFTRSTKVIWTGINFFLIIYSTFLYEINFLKTSLICHRLFCSMLCSDPKLDSHRFKDILDEAISSGKIYNSFIYFLFINGKKKKPIFVITRLDVDLQETWSWPKLTRNGLSKSLKQNHLQIHWGEGGSESFVSVIFNIIFFFWDYVFDKWKWYDDVWLLTGQRKNRMICML